MKTQEISISTENKAKVDDYNNKISVLENKCKFL